MPRSPPWLYDGARDNKRSAAGAWPIIRTGLFTHNQSLPDVAVTPAYLVEHGWLVGSPQTVTDKLRQMYDDIGGFGCLLVLTFDQLEDNAGWANSQRLLVEKVMPHFVDLQPD